MTPTTSGLAIAAIAIGSVGLLGTSAVGVAIPTFLGVNNAQEDRATQMSLTNAVTEADALNQNSGQSFAAAAPEFSHSAPEFDWTSGGCSPSQPVCMSYEVHSLNAPGDSQELVLAAASAGGSCWYILQNMETPGAADMANPFAGATTAGSFYADAGLDRSGTCSARDPAESWSWYSSWSAAAGHRD